MQRAFDIKQVRFKVGSVVRYGHGSTALMRVDTYNIIGRGQDEVHYYGEHCLGGVCAGYGLEVRPLRAGDAETWEFYRRHRNLAQTRHREPPAEYLTTGATQDEQ